MNSYNSLSEQIQEKIKNNISDKHIFDEAIRRDMSHDKPNLWRPAFVRDVEKILHSPYYNRYSDKTQVFSFYKNDDISRRALHVQLVSRIARNIGRMLGLNLDLIEAIALGHDMGHTPFGHSGERYLNKLYNEHTGRYFNHNVHSVRVLDKLFHYNISLQTLDGILCHNGEFEMQEYRPVPMKNFTEFDNCVEQCYTQKDAVSHLVPCTLEGCVVRICDMIAYIGKDRQDAVRTHLIDSDDIFEDGSMGRNNAAIINNLIVNIVENSYGKDYIKLDDALFEDLKKAKADNYRYIYDSEQVSKKIGRTIEPMFEKIYMRILDDLKEGNKKSPVYTHHIKLINDWRKFYKGEPYELTPPDDIVVDYISGMTDDYFVELYYYLFPKAKKIEYVSYFD